MKNDDLKCGKGIMWYIRNDIPFLFTPKKHDNKVYTIWTGREGTKYLEEAFKEVYKSSKNNK